MSTSSVAASAGGSPAWHSVAYLAVALLLAAGSLTGGQVAWWQWVAVALLLPAGVVGVLLRQQFSWLLPVVGLASALSGINGLLEVGLFSLALRRRDRVTAGIAVAATVATVTQAAVLRPPASGEPAPSSPLLTLLIWLSSVVIQVVVPVVAGGWLGSHRELVGSLRERARVAESERELRTEQAVLRERERIAREMHDSLGHKLALIAMHAGALEVNAGQGEAGVVAQAELIRTVARQALGDLRGLVGALGTGDGPSRIPQPGLAEIADLVASSRAAGSRVTLTEALNDPAEIPEPVGRALYRIVQESLTNAHRHAPGLPVEVTITGAPGKGVGVSIANPLARTPQPAGGGTGLAGLAERARLLGGTLAAGADTGRFVVRAELPWPIGAAP